MTFARVLDTLVIDSVYAGRAAFASFPLMRALAMKRGHMGTYYYRICPWGHIQGTYSVCAHMLRETSARMTACIAEAHAPMTACIDASLLLLCMKSCLG